MSRKIGLLAVGFVIWITPMLVYAMTGPVLHEGASWWWLVPIIGLSVAFHALLEWYVSLTVRAAIFSLREG